MLEKLGRSKRSSLFGFAFNEKGKENVIEF
jgi:hypothetical protein